MCDRALDHAADRTSRCEASELDLVFHYVSISMLLRLPLIASQSMKHAADANAGCNPNQHQ